MNSVHYIVHAAVMVLSLSAGFYVYTNFQSNRKKSAHILAFSLLVIAVGAGAQLLERAFEPLILKQIFDSVEDIAMYVFPLSWIYFTSIYSGQDFHKNTFFKVFVTVFSVFTVGSVLLQYKYPIIFKGIRISEHGLLVPVEQTLIYYTIVTGIFVLIFIGLLSFLRFTYTSNKQTASAVFIVFSAISILGGSIFVIQKPEFPLHIVSLVFFIVGVIIAIELDLFMTERIAQSAVYEHITNPVIVLNEQRELVDYNKEAEQFEQLNIEDHIGKHISQFLDDEVCKQVEAADKHGEITFEYFSENGSVYKIQSTKVVHHGRHIGYTLLSQDITDIKRAQNQMKRRKEELEQFASFISHDLRNPLNAIQGSASIIEDEVEEDRLQKAAQIIVNSTNRMETMIEDMETMFRESQKETDVEPVFVEEIVENAIEILSIDDGNITVQVESDKQIYADKSKLQSVFENLFKNAREHVGDDVTITVTCSNDTISVIDDGPGVPEKIQDSLFDFGATTSNEGTGLGLAIVKEMVNAHGWEITVDTEYKDGAKFDITGIERVKQQPAD